MHGVYVAHVLSASAALIAALKQEKEQLTTLIDRTTEAHVAELEAKLAFYENVSGVSIKGVSDKKHQFACTRHGTL